MMFFSFFWYSICFWSFIFFSWSSFFIFFFSFSFIFSRFFFFFRFFLRIIWSFSLLDSLLFFSFRFFNWFISFCLCCCSSVICRVNVSFFFFWGFRFVVCWFLNFIISFFCFWIFFIYLSFFVCSILFVFCSIDIFCFRETISVERLKFIIVLDISSLDLRFSDIYFFLFRVFCSRAFFCV